MAKKKARPKTNNGAAKPKKSSKKSKSKEPPSKKASPGKAVPIERRVPENLQTIFANNFAIQHEQTTCTLLFFEIRPPIILGDNDPALKKLTKVDANCVSRVVVPGPLVPEIIKVMQEHSRKYLAAATIQIKN